MEQPPTPKQPQASFSSLVDSALPGALRRDMHTERPADLMHSIDISGDALVELHQRLKSRTLINKLPPEILGYIFEEALRPCGSGYMRSRASERVHTRPLLSLSHVSSRWRTIALNKASLWTRTDNHNKAQFDAFLERSQAMPLSLTLLPHDAQSLDRLLQEQGHRIRRLDITEHPHHVHPPARLQGAKLPLLECLTISGNCDSEEDWNDEPEATPILFGEHVCRIRAFALRPLCGWIPGNHFPHLTHLYLSEFSGRMLHDDTMRYLTGLLSNTPVLEYLYISELREVAAVTQTSIQAALPSLRALTCVCSDLAAALLLLKHVKLPEDALVRLTSLYCCLRQPNGGDYLPHPLLSDRFLASFTRLEIVADDVELHLVAEGPRSGLWIGAAMDTANNEPDPWAPWVGTLHMMLPLATIRTLHVCFWEPEMLPHHVLPHVPNLTELAVRIHPDFLSYDDGPCRGLLSALFGGLAGDNDPPGVKLQLCPALESLGVEIHGGDPWDFGLPPSSEVVPRMLAARADTGKPLRRLALQPHMECDLEEQFPDMPDEFEAALAPLRQYVDVVELVRDVESVVCPLKMNERWKVEAFEEYWELPEDEGPLYDIF